MLQDLEVWQEYDVHGYIIVYSITDRRSYQKAADVLTSIKYQQSTTTGCPRPIILVANKSDLERSRMIGKEGLDTCVQGVPKNGYPVLFLG